MSLNRFLVNNKVSINDIKNITIKSKLEKADQEQSNSIPGELEFHELDTIRNVEAVKLVSDYSANNSAQNRGSVIDVDGFESWVRKKVPRSKAETIIESVRMADQKEINRPGIVDPINLKYLNKELNSWIVKNKNNLKFVGLAGALTLSSAFIYPLMGPYYIPFIVGAGIISPLIAGLGKPIDELKSPDIQLRKSLWEKPRDFHKPYVEPSKFDSLVRKISSPVSSLVKKVYNGALSLFGISSTGA